MDRPRSADHLTEVPETVSENYLMSAGKEVRYHLSSFICILRDKESILRTSISAIRRYYIRR